MPGDRLVKVVSKAVTGIEGKCTGVRSVNSENTEKLMASHPVLYQPLRKDGFWCGDGWFGILNELSEGIARLAMEEGGTMPSVIRVKEKFGGLRYYLSNVEPQIQDAVYELVRVAEDESTRTCESCGAPGIRHTKNGVVRTLCENCKE